MNRFGSAVILSLIFAGTAGGEAFRTIIAGKLIVSADSPAGVSIPLSYIDSVSVQIEGDKRFLRGIEFDVRTPQPWLKYRSSMAAAFYAPLKALPAEGVADLNLERIGFEVLPNKLQTIFHIPVRKGHGLKASPYVSMPTAIVPASSFPILFRLMPVIKGLPENLETLKFQLHVKPILSEEGAVHVAVRYPEKLKDKPYTLLIDDKVVSEPIKDQFLTEGEHSIAVVSDYYRNEVRRVVIERAKLLELSIDLQDPTPVVQIEAPENAKVFFNGAPVADPRKPFNAEPGEHEVRFVIGDYAVVKPISVRRGRNYRVALSIDVSVDESE